MRFAPIQPAATRAYSEPWWQRRRLGLEDREWPDAVVAPWDRISEDRYTFACFPLVPRPPDLSYFCLEPITHPIDAFHLPGRPGLAVLPSGETLSLKDNFMVSGYR